MGVVKRGLWAWRLFHFFNATESRYYGDAQSAHLPQCSATQASGPTRISRKDFALQSPSNPKRATRSGVEEKSGISAEGRAKRVPGSALRLVKGAPTDPDALLSGIRFLGFAVSLHGRSEQFELVEGTSSH